MTTEPIPPTGDEIDVAVDIIRARDELAEIIEDIGRIEARVEDEDPLARPLAEIHDELEATLRRLAALVAPQRRRTHRDATPAGRI